MLIRIFKKKKLHLYFIPYEIQTYLGKNVFTSSSFEFRSRAISHHNHCEFCFCTVKEGKEEKKNYSRNSFQRISQRSTCIE